MIVDSFISDVDPEYTFERAAEPWISAGYPVIPLAVKKRARRGLTASTDRGQVHSWSSQFPTANPGVVLNDLPIVVIDVDGTDGEVALTQLLADAHCDLPATYEETTGRSGGRHVFLRLPAVGEFRNQTGGVCGRPHGLDVLVNGHVVVAGARHGTGRRYESCNPPVPVNRLPEIPGPLYRLLVTRGQTQAAPVGPARLDDSSPTARAQPPDGPAVQALATVCDEHGQVPAGVAALLADCRDGRDDRGFRAVTLLVHAGWCERCIIAAVLGAPLGRKARQVSPWDPSGWVRHKIQSVTPLDRFDRDSYWAAAHTAGLTSGQLRVLDYLVAVASPGLGRVVAGYSRIGLGSAMDQPRSTLLALVSAGWLQVVTRAAVGAVVPTEYRLTVPNEPDGGQPGPEVRSDTGRTGSPNLPSLSDHLQPWVPPPPHPPHPPDVSSLWFMTAVSGHDAFRRARGSLGPAYPLFAVLTDTATDSADLARWLGSSVATVKRHADLLVQAGVAVWTPSGLRLAPTGLLTALDESARRAGTSGARSEALRKSLEAAHQWRDESQAWRADYDRIGSEVWLAYNFQQLLAIFEGPACADLRRVRCEEGGVSLGDLVMECLNGQIDMHRRRPGRLARPVA